MTSTKQYAHCTCKVLSMVQVEDSIAFGAAALQEDYTPKQLTRQKIEPAYLTCLLISTGNVIFGPLLNNVRLGALLVVLLNKQITNNDWSGRDGGREAEFLCGLMILGLSKDMLCHV